MRLSGNKFRTSSWWWWDRPNEFPLGLLLHKIGPEKDFLFFSGGTKKEIVQLDIFPPQSTAVAFFALKESGLCKTVYIVWVGGRKGNWKEYNHRGPSSGQEVRKKKKNWLNYLQTLLRFCRIYNRPAASFLLQLLLLLVVIRLAASAATGHNSSFSCSSISSTLLIIGGSNEETDSSSSSGKWIILLRHLCHCSSGSSSSTVGPHHHRDHHSFKSYKTDG